MHRPATVIVDAEEGEEVTVTVVRRRVEPTPAGPGIAAAVVEIVAEGQARERWRDVVNLAAARARRAG